MSARTAIWRWSWRVVRRDWRQHALVIALIAAGLAASTVIVTTVFRFQDAEERNFTEQSLAGASGGIDLWADPGSQPDLRTDLAAVLADLPDVEIVGTGDVDERGIELVEAEPERPLVGPWFRLVEGQWPGPGEVTLTTETFDYLADLGTPTAIGDEVTLADRTFTVVGRYRNGASFRDTTALVSPGEAGTWASARVLTDGSPSDLESRIATVVDAAGPGYSWGPITPFSYDPETTVFTYGLAAMLCLAVAALSSAGFTVLANRRSRQLGVLAGLGATPTHLGAAMLSTGAVVGLVGAVIGVAVGVGVSLALSPTLENLVDYELGFRMPWRHLLPLVALGVLTAIAGAWRPAQRARSVSAAAAIADRPTRQEGFARSLAVGIALVAAGSIAMIIGAPRNDPMLVIIGVLLPGAGGLLLAPALTAVLGRLAGRAPLPIRMAWRDIDRNRSRSSGAVAAAAMAIGIPFAIATFVGSLGQSWAPMPDNVARVYIATENELDAVTATVPGAQVVPIEFLTHPAWAADDEAAEFGPAPWGVRSLRGNGSAWFHETAIATPELLAAMGVDRDTDADLIVDFRSPLDLGDETPAFVSFSGSGTAVSEAGTEVLDALTDGEPSELVVQRHAPWAESFPEALIVDPPTDVPGAERYVDSYLLVGDRPFTDQERAALRATGAGLSLGDDPPPFVAIRAIAMAAGALFAVAAIAVTVALIRTETARDQRILRSLGASPARARAVGAATAAGLATIASAIAVLVSLSVLIGIFRNPDEDFFFRMPWAELGVVFVVVPLLAGVAGWLLTSGRADRSSSAAFG